jgi:hypothetical protein
VASVAGNATTGDAQTSPMIFGASVAGPGHIRHSLPCQDAHEWAVFGKGRGYFAIADGLGSARHSSTGATTAVAAAVEAANALMRRRRTVDVRRVAVACVVKARSALEAKAKEDSVPLDSLACTIISVAVMGDSVCVAHIGDGAVVVRTETGVEVLSSPEESKFIDQVTPITIAGWRDKIRVTPLLKGASVVAAFSDGCQRAALTSVDGRFTPSGGFIAPLFSFVEAAGSAGEGAIELRSFLAGSKMSAHSEDDKTLVLAALQADIAPNLLGRVLSRIGVVVRTFGSRLRKFP